MEDLFEMKFIGAHYYGKEHTTEKFIAYVKEQLLVNKRCIGRKELFQEGFHVRACGRSTLIALSLLEEARNSPGIFVKWHSHIDLPQERESIKRKCEMIMQLVPDYQDMWPLIVKNNRVGFQYREDAF